MIKILNTDDAGGNGSPFHVKGGEYQVIVNHAGANVKIQILFPGSSPEKWIDTNEEFEDDGVQTMYLSSEGTYRATGTGSEAYLQTLDPAPFLERGT